MPGDLGDRIGLVGRLQRPGQHRVLAHRLRREFRIDAGRAEKHQLLGAVADARRGSRWPRWPDCRRGIPRAACCWRRCRRPWPPPETPPAASCSQTSSNTAAWSQQIELAARRGQQFDVLAAPAAAPARRRPCRDGRRRRPSCLSAQTERLPLAASCLAIFEIARDHVLDQLRKAGLRLPAELLPRLAGVADQQIDLGRTEIGRDRCGPRSCRISCRRRFPRRPCRATRSCGRPRQTPARRIRAPSASRRSPARNRRARPPAGSHACPRHNPWHGPSRAWRRDCRDRACLRGRSRCGRRRA